jgi:hypothetical protein
MRGSSVLELGSTSLFMRTQVHLSCTSPPKLFLLLSPGIRYSLEFRKWFGEISLSVGGRDKGRRVEDIKFSMVCE